MTDFKDYELSKARWNLDGSSLRAGRDIDLVLCEGYHWSTCDPILTVEHHTKWYELYLVRWDPHEPEGTEDTVDLFRVYKIHYGFLEKVCPPGVSPYLDHAPNPLCVRLFARRNGYHLDELGFELITGRWQLEYVDSNVMECARCEGTGEVVITAPTATTQQITTCRACRGYGETRPAK
jgi:hypothetical protein